MNRKRTKTFNEKEQSPQEGDTAPFGGNPPPDERIPFPPPPPETPNEFNTRRHSA